MLQIYYLSISIGSVLMTALPLYSVAAVNGAVTTMTRPSSLVGLRPLLRQLVPSLLPSSLWLHWAVNGFSHPFLFAQAFLTGSSSPARHLVRLFSR